MTMVDSSNIDYRESNGKGRLNTQPQSEINGTLCVHLHRIQSKRPPGGMGN